jgi:hypothetical protein
MRCSAWVTSDSQKSTSLYLRDGPSPSPGPSTGEKSLAHIPIPKLCSPLVVLGPGMPSKDMGAVHDFMTKTENDTRTSKGTAKGTG